MSQPVKLYTVQLSQWRKVQAQGIGLINITAKSGDLVFAPDFKKVLQYKNKELTEAEYTEAYLGKMRASLKSQASRWYRLEEIAQQQPVALACYCKAGVFCHRLLFLDYFTKFLTSRGKEVEYLGEIT